MKTPNLFKKIDTRVIQALVPVAIVGIFIYVFYYQYDQYSRYRASKNMEASQAVESTPLNVPEFFNFSLDNEENLVQYMLFTFDKAKAKAPVSAAGSSAEAGSGNYTILGVVKKDRLFLLVRFSADNKIQLYGEGTSIDGNSRVDRLSTDQVTIVDASGQSQTHKIFQTTYGFDASAAGKDSAAGKEKEADLKPVKPESIEKGEEKKIEEKRIDEKRIDEKSEKRVDERRGVSAGEEIVDEEAPPPDEDVPPDENVEKVTAKDRDKDRDKDKKEKEKKDNKKKHGKET